MSNCPNCNRRLRITDWRQNCPQCGVNLMFHGFEKRFYEDAKRSELSFASMRVGSKQKKAAMKGNAAAKTRLFTCILPLISLFVPMGTLSANLPFAEKEWSAGLMYLVNLVMSGGANDIAYLRLMLSSAQAPLFKAGAAMLLAMAAAAVFGLAAFVTSMFCFLNLKRWSLSGAIVSTLGALFCAGGFAAGIMVLRSSAALDSAFFSGSLGMGAPISFAAFAFIAALNFILYQKGVPVEYNEGDVERAEIYAKLKRGEVSLDDLPFPVIVTESDRERELTAEKETGGAIT
ncbi:MAG: hypothetical protein FWF05_03430 [Oscillospiraceae bacterium]|nr:hypothetical protein [Oscillospiraceae bacterium]